MSFQDKGFWMAKGGDQLSDGETVYTNSSRIESKRPYQWLNNTAEPEAFSNKKQAVQVPVSQPTSGISTAVVSWENCPGFHSAPNQSLDRLFSSDSTRSVNFGENISAHGLENSDMGKKATHEQFGNALSAGLPGSYPLEDTEPCVSYGGIRKVKVNQVKDSQHGSHAANENNFGMTLEQTYSRETESAFISMGQAFSKECEHVSLMGHSRVETNMTMDSTFAKADENTMSLAHSFTKGDSSTLSFGGYQDEAYIDALSRPLNSYDLLYSQSSVQIAEIPGAKELDAPNAPIVSSSQAQKSKPDSLTKSKSESKPARKEAPNSFPSNVRSLIATGMLDGVPVRYVSASREELRGIIKGSGYLCGCQSCNYSKALNAYEFERHAGCKTKHPNNHIYFENGKTIYQIVQELRSTPESLLFDAIQTVTGSPINQKAFRIWKESFQAATRELQRIYGKEELNL